ncbi:acyltransferase family protein [Clostridium ragsdalei P11]|uniref:Acyltransferase family protein n=1 Tax=Clostridium ragsdalei P11 TaxID=1353534 RepID=A0A1A6AIK4_9CLOT|nr:acyltransferase family protein [Clostridium ragsdalei]OBR89900.1 acyltransferase family protein [Clostridium ragsdalei P11]
MEKKRIKVLLINKQRNISVDVIRGFGIMVVVLGHSIQVSLLLGEASFLWNLILIFQMPLLMYISGYAAGFSFPSKNPKLFIKKKVSRLLIPYLVWVIIHYFLRQFVIGDKVSFAGIFEAIYRSDFWFLRYLFMYFCLLWLVDCLLYYVLTKFKYTNDSYEHIVILMLLIGTIGINFILAKLPLIKYSISIWYYSWFVIGFITFMYKKVISKYINFIGNIVVIVSIATVVWKDMGHVAWNKVVGILIVLAICWTLYRLTNYVFKSKDLNVLKMGINALASIGKNTLPIYAIHWCLFFSPPFICGFYRNIRLSTGISYYVMTAVIFVMWLVGSLLIIKLLQKFTITRRVLLGVQARL